MDGVVEPASEKASKETLRTSRDLTNSEALAATVHDLEFVEIMPGVLLRYGQLPAGLDLANLETIPGFEVAQFARSLGVLGNAGGAAGSLTQALQNATGLYRLSTASQALLESGASLVVKDGAHLGAIVKNGRIIAQARFIPLSAAPAVLGAIGPAVAMLGLEMQISALANLVRQNTQIAKETQALILNEQHAELDALADSMDHAVTECIEVGTITQTIWDTIAPHESQIYKQLRLWNKKVVDHVRNLTPSDWGQRRDYLQRHAQGIVSDIVAMQSALKTFAQYQLLRAARAQKRGVTDQEEAKHFDYLAQSLSERIKKESEEINKAAKLLFRDLHILTELNLPLIKDRKKAEESRRICEELLKCLEPLTNNLGCVVPEPEPSFTCAPTGYNPDDYLNILRWLLEDGEEIKAVAFLQGKSSAGFGQILSAGEDLLGRILGSGVRRVLYDPLTSYTLVTVTNRRIVTVNPQNFLQKGEVERSYQLCDVEYARPLACDEAEARVALTVKMVGEEIRWMFPADVDASAAEALAVAISGRKQLTPARGDG